MLYLFGKNGITHVMYAKSSNKNFENITSNFGLQLKSQRMVAVKKQGVQNGIKVNPKLLNLTKRLRKEEERMKNK